MPGSQAALARLRQAGVECRFVTNTTKDTISNLLALVQGLGFDIQRQEVGGPWLVWARQAARLLSRCCCGCCAEPCLAAHCPLAQRISCQLLLPTLMW